MALSCSQARNKSVGSLGEGLTWEAREETSLSGHRKYIPLPPLPSRCHSDSAVPCPGPMKRGRCGQQAQTPRAPCVAPWATSGRWGEAGTVTLLAAGPREVGGTEAAGALAGAPV